MMMWLLKIAATLMLFVVVAIDAVILAAWIAAGIIEGAINQIPFWVILIVAFLTFVQILISSFLYGVARQVAAAPPSSPSMSDDTSFGGRLSNTLDEGWKTSIRASSISGAIAGIVLVGLVGVFFNDLRFLAGIHRGMELESSRDYSGAQKWFKLAMGAVDKDRLAIARFMYSGSLLRERNFTVCESELQKTLSELDPQNEDQQGLYVYTLFELANCYQYQNKLSEAESSAAEAVKMLEAHPHMLGLSVRMIGPYKQFLIPDPPPVSLAVAGLNAIYVKQGRLELALATYERILNILGKEKALPITDVYLELLRFEGQLTQSKNSDAEATLAAAKRKTSDFAVRHCGIKSGAEFEQGYKRFTAHVL
ncbi:MAG TPA: hypothetical protein V6C76_03325 [Drouetiella sp.]